MKCNYFLLVHELVFIIFLQFSKSLTSSSASSSSTSSTNSISISTSFSSSSFSNRSTSSQALPISNCSPANSYIDTSDTDSALSNANYSSPQPSTSFSSPPPSNKRRRTSLPTGSTKASPAVLKEMHKSTQTAAIVTGLQKQCNVCLSEEEKGYWVGCDHKSKKCQYWVHGRCLGFSFKNKAELKKVTYKCPAHM